MGKLIEDPFQDQYYKGKKPAGILKKYYVIFEGEHTGIYDVWEDVKNKVEGVSNAKYKSFASYREAEWTLKKHLQQ